VERKAGSKERGYIRKCEREQRRGTMQVWEKHCPQKKEPKTIVITSDNEV